MVFYSQFHFDLCCGGMTQGKAFDQQYEATSKIQSSSVNWSIRNLSEKKRVGVEIWDVVDKEGGGLVKVMEMSQGDWRMPWGLLQPRCRTV